MTITGFIAAYRKFVTALVGAVGIAVSQGLIVGAAAKWTAVVIAFLTALAVSQVSNIPPQTPSD